MIVIGVRVGMRPVRLFGFNGNDRDQWQAQITHFSEQAMQRGLVDYGAGEQRIAVVFQREGQAPKPVCPMRPQMALDPDLIDRRLIGIIRWAALVRHFPALDLIPVVAGIVVCVACSMRR